MKSMTDDERCQMRDALIHLLRGDIRAKRFSNADDVVEVLVNVAPCDAEVWKLRVELEKRRGRPQRAEAYEEVASWFM